MTLISAIRNALRPGADNAFPDDGIKPGADAPIVEPSNPDETTEVVMSDNQNTPGAGDPSAQEAAATAAKNAERTRIQAIIGSDEAKGRTELASYLAYETDMTADAAKTMLAKAPVTAAQPFTPAPSYEAQRLAAAPIVMPQANNDRQEKLTINSSEIYERRRAALSN